MLFPMTDLWLPSDEDIALMTEAEINEVAELLQVIRQEDDSEWIAQPKQALATELTARATEVLYGGAAGGGKSEWLLRHVMQEMVDHPYNRGVIFRRLFPSLQRTLIPRAKMFYPQYGGVWNGQTHTFTFPNHSIVEFASLQYEDTVLEHQGAEYGIVAVEEITEFLESQIDYVIGRLRAPAPGIRPHLIGTANPGGRGHRWVKRRWVKPKPIDHDGQDAPKIYQVWTPAPNPDNPEPNVRVFIPATLEDNPALLLRDPGYRARMRAMAGTNKGLAKAMEHGDWDAIDAIEGALWTGEDINGGRISFADYKQHVTVVSRVLAIDPSDGNEDGKGDEFGIAVVARGADGCGYIERSEGWRASPAKMAKMATTLARELGCEEIVVEKNHGGKWVKQVLFQADRYANVQEVWASDGKVTRARPVAALFERDDLLEETPYRCRMVGYHEDLEDECTTFTGAPGEVSPNRLDAMVWGVSRQFLGLRVIGEGSDYDDKRHEGRR
jgi:hypothetical protein